ncbi:integrase catalytic domain-containing protein [Kitasatospora sp. P5_F3]
MPRPFTKAAGPRKVSGYHAYVIIDIFSRHIVGHTVELAESAERAEELIRETIARNAIVPETVHPDRGTSMTSKKVSQLLMVSVKAEQAHLDDQGGEQPRARGTRRHRSVMRRPAPKAPGTLRVNRRAAHLRSRSPTAPVDLAPTPPSSRPTQPLPPQSRSSTMKITSGALGCSRSVPVKHGTENPGDRGPEEKCAHQE